MSKKSHGDWRELEKREAIIWGKLPGFPNWPCRFCSEPETKHLTSKKSKSTKMDQVAVVFLGKYLEKAWIATNTVQEFTPSSMLDAGSKLFSDKKFNTAKEADYRCAVKEAMRLVAGTGIKFPPQLIEMAMAWDDREPAWVRSTRDTCVVCHGTEGSGPALYCSGCQEKSIHFHCAETPLLTCEAYWYCPDCCDSHGRDSSVIYPLKPVEESASEDEEDEEDDDDEGSVTKKGSKKADKGGGSGKSKAKNGSGKGAGGSDSLQSLGKDGEKKKGGGNGGSSSKSKSGSGGGGGGSNKSSGGGGGGNGSGGLSQRQQQQLLQFLLNMQQQLGLGTVQMMPNGQLGMSGQYPAGMLDKGMGYRGRVQAGMPTIPSALAVSGEDAMEVASTDIGGMVPEEDEESTVSIDYCFVCGEGGTLVLCDFPQCPRAYHQACVTPTFPSSLNAHPSNADLDDPWFCPAHHCAMCNTLESTRVDLKYLHLPSHYADIIRSESRRRHGLENASAAIKQEELVSCEGCPFSVCKGCEADYAAAHAPPQASVNYAQSGAAQGPATPSLFKSQGKEILPPFLQQRAGATVSGGGGGGGGGAAKAAGASVEGQTLGAKIKGSSGGSHRYCLNCTSVNPHLALARVLEAGWSRAAVTRSAAPFFRNLRLPAVCVPVATGKGTGAAGVGSSTTTTTATTTTSSSTTTTTSTGGEDSDVGSGTPPSSSRPLISSGTAVDRDKARANGGGSSSSSSSSSGSSSGAEEGSDAGRGRKRARDDSIGGDSQASGKGGRDASSSSSSGSHGGGVLVKGTSLVRIITKIRTLQYRKKDEFLSDLQSLKALVTGQPTVEKSRDLLVAVASEAETENGAATGTGTGTGTGVDGSREQRQRQGQRQDQGAMGIAELVALEEKESHAGPSTGMAGADSSLLTEDQKATMLLAVNSLLQNVQTVLRDRQHVVARLEADIKAQAERGPRQARTVASSSSTSTSTSTSSSTSSGGGGGDGRGSTKKSRPSGSASPKRSRSRDTDGTAAAGGGGREPSEDFVDNEKSCLGVYAADSLSGAMERLWRKECGRALPLYKQPLDAYPHPQSIDDCILMLDGAVVPSLTTRPGAVPLKGNLAAEVDKKVEESMLQVVEDNAYALAAVAGSSSSSGGGGGGGGGPGMFTFTDEATNMALPMPYHEYDYRQFDAAQVMYGLRDTNRGETVTLMEDRSAYEQWDPTNRINEMLATDETLVTLDRLREMTTKTLHLESRLRKEYLETKQFVRSSGVEKVTIGEVHLVKELKLANDDLRWRINGKNRTIGALTTSLNEVQEQAKGKDDELLRLKDDIKHLRNEVEQAKLASISK